MKPDEPYEPTAEDLAFMKDADKGYIGTAPINIPLVKHISERDPDPFYWKRKKAAERLGVSENELEDEPDNDPGSAEQAYA